MPHLVVGGHILYCIIQTVLVFSQNEIDRLYCLLTKMLDQFHDGVHGFLFVLNIAEHRFTKEHEEIFNLLYKQVS